MSSNKEEKETVDSANAPFDRLNTSYLDRFITYSNTSSQLIRMQIFPNVKEITESMAAFVHTKKEIMSQMPEKEATGTIRDAIFCVGDGSTPRSAALFALEFPKWECYSIDPQLKEGFIHTRDREKSMLKHNMDEIRKRRRTLWNEVSNLHVVGECMETVRIRCRYAVIVLIHCHLSFQQIMSSIECEHLLGVLTLPCCNYFEVQQYFMGQFPDKEFKDDAIWSEKNTVRLWVKPKLNWIDDYTPVLRTEHVIIPFVIPSPYLYSNTDIANATLGDSVDVAGEVVAVRKFGKHLTFVFINTSNVYYNENDDSYYYYDCDGYDSHNKCLNMCSLVLRICVHDNNEEQYKLMYDHISELKLRTLILGKGQVVLSQKQQKIVELSSYSILANNKQIANAQRFIAGVDMDFLNIECNNERNINFVNKKN